MIKWALSQFTFRPAKVIVNDPGHSPGARHGR